jgi:creatinine amidohydrolase
MRTITVLVIAFLSSSSAWAQAVPQMRTRLLTGLTNTEIEQYLKRNDVIFVPVGTVEPHGGLPIDCEYVGPLAYAIKMAEATDGLVLPGMAYFFPDATIVGRGAVHVTPSEGTPRPYQGALTRRIDYASADSPLSAVHHNLELHRRLAAE